MSNILQASSVFSNESIILVSLEIVLQALFC